MPKANKLRLMRAPSCNLAPEFLVSAARSDPARSIIDNLDVRLILTTPPFLELYFSDDSMAICKTACDREDSALARVGSCLR